VGGRERYHPRVPLPNFMLDQLSRPSGKLAGLTALLLNSINARTILAGVSALELRRGQRVVEIGFGGGLSLPFLLRAIGDRGQVFATETSKEMLARARRRFIVQRLQGRLRVEQAVIEALPLGDGAFDAALSLNTIPFWTDLEQAMRELARVLAVDGRLVLGVPDPAHVLAAGFAERGFRVVDPERLGERFERFGFELLEIRRTGDGTALLVGRRVDDESPDGL
jgi:arsenite methyltransferase